MESKNTRKVRRNSKEVKNKLKHKKLIEERMKLWSIGEITSIESCIYPKKDNDNYILSLKQNSSSGKTVGSLVLHNSNLPSFIELLTKIHENQMKNIIIDEWDINSEQSKFRRTLSELAVRELKDIFWDVVKEECNGCIIDHPSQRQHPCLNGIEENIENLFITLINRIERKELMKECCEITEKTFREETMMTKDTLLDDYEWQDLTKQLLIKALSFSS